MATIPREGEAEMREVVENCFEDEMWRFALPGKKRAEEN